MVSSGMTPLFFKGSEGATLKPFIPSVRQSSQKSSDQLTAFPQGKQHVQDESKMSRADLSNA